MITSSKGKQMIQNITPIYAKSKIEQAIYEAIGSEFDSGEELAQEVLLQLFPQTATWGLIFWEERVNLPTNTNEDIERRRRKVIARLQTRCPITPERMAAILSNYTGADIRIPEYLDSKFEVRFITKTGINGHFNEIIKEIDRIKPSHTSYKFIINYLSEYIIQQTFTKWMSEEIKACGTFNNMESIIATDGWSFKESLVNTLSKFYSDEFLIASEDTYSVEKGYSIKKFIINLVSRFFSEPFLIASESTYSTADGFRFNTQLINKFNNYLTDPMPACSENLFSIGGELVYDS